MRKTTEPFRVICKLYDGRVNSVNGLFYLDSIIYHAWFLKYDPEVIYGIKGKNGKQQKHLNFGLPLTKTSDNRYLASCGFYKQYNQSIEYWNKRPDFTNARNSEYLDARGKIDTSAGPLKAYHFPQIIRTVSDIEFYGVGTIEKIKDLLSYIPAIGKKPSEGWGRVKEWIVEPFTDDWSTFGKYGLMRPMPVNQVCIKDNNYQIMDSPIRPPYWKMKETKVCYIPRVIINDN